MSGNILPPQPLLSQTGPLVAGFSQSALRGVLDSSAQTYSQLALKVVQYIQGVLADAANANLAVAQKVATPIVAGLNAAQETISQLGGQVANQISAGLASATAPCQSGCAAEQGAAPGQYKYNVWQDYDVPVVIAFSVGSSAPPSPPANWCFRAGWDDYYDAIKYKEEIQGSTPPAGCKLPGGTASPPGGGPGPIQSGAGGYALWCNSGNTPAFVITAWPDPTTPAQPPPPSPGAYGQYNGLYASQDLALADAKSSTACGGGQVGTPADWYGGCVAGAPVAFEGQANGPPGVTSVSGPYASQALALEAASAACVPPGPTGGPPNQSCCAVTQAKGDCLFIDLCDWKKFEDSLYNALCRWYKDCLCKLNAEALAVQEDCEGLVGPPWQEWMGSLGSLMYGAGSINDVVGAAANGLPGSFDTGPGQTLPPG